MSGTFSHAFTNLYDHENTNDLGDSGNSQGSIFNLTDSGSGDYRFTMGTPGWETINWTVANTDQAHGDALNFAGSWHNTVNLSGNLSNFHLQNMGNDNTIFVKGTNANSNNLILDGYGNGALLSGSKNSINVTGGGTGSNSGYSNYNWADTDGSNNTINLYGTNSPNTEYALIRSSASNGNTINMFGNNGAATVNGGTKGTVNIGSIFGQNDNNTVVLNVNSQTVWLNQSCNQANININSNSNTITSLCDKYTNTYTIAAGYENNTLNITHETVNETIRLNSAGNTIITKYFGGATINVRPNNPIYRFSQSWNLGTFKNFCSPDYINISGDGKYFQDYQLVGKTLTIHTQDAGASTNTYTANISGKFVFNVNGQSFSVFAPVDSANLVEAMASTAIPEVSANSPLASTSLAGATTPALAVVH